MNMKHTIAIVVIAVIVGAIGGSIANAYFTEQHRLRTNGTFEAFGVTLTWEATGEPATTVDWGTVYPGEPYVMEPIRITNIQTIPATLVLTTDDLVGDAVLELTWNYDESVIQPDAWVIVELTQTATGSGAFTYTTVVTANEYVP